MMEVTDRIPYGIDKEYTRKMNMLAERWHATKWAKKHKKREQLNNRLAQANYRANDYGNTRDKRALTASEWEILLHRQKHHCYWCRQRMVNIVMDHVIPLSRGGQHVKENIVLACPGCNSRKHTHLWTLV